MGKTFEQDSPLADAIQEVAQDWAQSRDEPMVHIGMTILDFWYSPRIARRTPKQKLGDIKRIIKQDIDNWFELFTDQAKEASEEM